MESIRRAPDEKASLPVALIVGEAALGSASIDALCRKLTEAGLPPRIFADVGGDTAQQIVEYGAIAAFIAAGTRARNERVDFGAPWALGGLGVPTIVVSSGGELNGEGEAEMSPLMSVSDSAPPEEFRLAVESVLARQRSTMPEPTGRAILNAIVDAAPEGTAFLIIDVKDGLLAASKSLREMLGFSVDELRRLGVASLTHPDDMERDLAAFNSLLRRQRGSYQVEKRLLHKNGTVLWARVSVSLMESLDAAQALRVLVVAENIEDRKAAERAARESEAIVEQIVRAQGSLFWAMRPDRRSFVYVSPAVERAIGRSREELLRDPRLWLDAIHSDDLPSFTAALRVDQQRPSKCTYRIFRSDGEMRWIDDEIFTITNDAGDVKLIAGFAEDVTQRRQQEQHRERLEACLRRRETLESLGILAGGVAHDFNNLLVGVLGNATLVVQDLEETSPTRVYADGIIGAAHRASDLCRLMMAYAGGGGLNSSSLDMSALVGEMVRMLGSSIGSHTQLRTTLAAGLPTVRGDPAQFRQLVMNIILNAADSLEGKRGLVALETRARQCTADDLLDGFLPPTHVGCELVELEVSDTGCGLDADTMSRMFEPFFTTKATGRGLGLSSVMGTLRSHQGGVHVSSDPGKGSTFKVFFPAEEKISHASTLAGPREQAHQGRFSGAILVVDDEELARTVARAMLETLGFSVTEASGGQAALQCITDAQRPYSAVLLDLTMPGMDGLTTLAAIHNIAPTQAVILTTGYSADLAIDPNAKLSVAGTLQKPYDLDTLADVFRRVLERVGGNLRI